MNSNTNLWISRHLALITQDATERVNSSITAVNIVVGNRPVERHLKLCIPCLNGFQGPQLLLDQRPQSGFLTFCGQTLWYQKCFCNTITIYMYSHANDKLVVAVKQIVVVFEQPGPDESRREYFFHLHRYISLNSIQFFILHYFEF